MGLSSRAAPGAEQRAELVVESACHLADAVTPTAWSEAAAEDALDAIDVLAAALSGISPETAEALAAMVAATAGARRQLGLPVDPETHPDEKEPTVPVPCGGQQPGPGMPSRGRQRRRGLGPGFRGIGATERRGQAGTVPPDGLLHRGGEVVEQMPAIRDLW
ncbi:hypothetical protein, partial [Streptomyces tsukubensis]|uniref:hypothetical protein n=1 Tax=Streptomyces tsukubensis TaxID=83656 RepID=UPI00344BD8FB